MLPGSNQQNSGLTGPRTWLLGALACVSITLALAWVDVLPGGWTLRGWVEPHASREARARQEHSERRLELFARLNREAPAGSIVFAGSSTMERFPLQEFFPGALVQNRGIGDEACADFLARVEASRPLAPPAGWVLYLASLDFRRLNDSAQDVSQRVERVLDELHSFDAQAPLTLIGILPEQSMGEAMVRRLAETNAALEELCKRRGVSFVNTARPPLVRGSGSLAGEYAADRLHLNHRGYEVLASWLLEASPFLASRLAGPESSTEEQTPRPQD